MKKIYSFITIASIVAYFAIGCSPSNSYVVTGKNTTGRCPDGEWAYLSIQKSDYGDLEYIDSVKIENNSFRFEGTIEQPTIAHIMTRVYNDSMRFPNPIILHSFILESGQITTACNDDDFPTPSGTELNDKITTFFTDFLSLLKTVEDKEEIYEYIHKLIAENADNEFGVFVADYIVDEFSPAHQLKAYALLKNKQEFFAGKIEEVKAALQFEVGNTYGDVTEPTADGKEISLKSVVEKEGNKYVLLEFWASWCGPCMHEMPKLKATYDKFHKKGFEVYASSLDSNKKKWKSAMKEVGMEWINVSGLNIAESPAPKKYGVTAIPANFLIDCSTGKIIAKNLRDEALEKKIEELLK